MSGEDGRYMRVYKTCTRDELQRGHVGMTLARKEVQL